MKGSSHLDRRRFLQTTTATVAAGGVVACSTAGPGYRFLTTHEAATVRALANQIVPPDDYPGAGDAGADRFADTELVTHYAHWQQSYRAGIAAIDDAAQKQFGNCFIDLTFDQQTRILEDREQTDFFRMIRDHSMQSFYGDPRHGGNPDAISWKMLGVPEPPVLGREHYDLTAPRTSEKG